MSLISCEVIGGLGNQLFQIALSYCLAKQYDRKIIFERISSSPSIFKNRDVYWNTIFSRIPTIRSSEFSKIKFQNIYEQGSQFQKIDIPNGDVLLHGYWQCYKYLEKYRDELRQLFTLPNMNTVNDEFKKIQEQYPDNKYVSIHVRRGDYLKLSHVHTVLNMDYYRQAINLLESYCSNLVFVIFSDDIKWCRENFGFLEKTYYPQCGKDVDEMHLMAKLDYHIIANSSFSWWGAFLSKDDHVIAPKEWMVPSRENKAMSDIYGPEWTRISQYNVSIIMPLYNGVEFLPESIGSVLKQTWEDWELLVGVNGYPENSDVYEKVKSEYTDPRIKVCDFHMCKGAPNTLNKLRENAKYNIIALIDADDAWLPDKLLQQLEVWKTNKYDVIGTNTQYFGESKVIPHLILGEIPRNTFLSFNTIICSSLMMRKEDAVWRNHFVYDYDMWLRMETEGKLFYNVPEILTMHRVHKQSFFNTSNNNLVEDLKLEWTKKRQELNKGKENITIVTCYYQMPNKYGNTAYLEWIENFLQIPCNMVIFTDETSREIIEKHRKKYDYCTKIIELPVR